MSEHESAEQELPPLVLPPANSDFDRLLALVAIVADPKACAARVKELKQATEAANRASAALDVKRAEHDAAVARDREEVTRKRGELFEQEARIAALNSHLTERQTFLAEWQHKLDVQTRRIEVFPGGMTREFSEGEPREVRDAHFDPMRLRSGDDVSGDEITERLPGPASVTLTRRADVRRGA